MSTRPENVTKEFWSTLTDEQKEALSPSEDSSYKDSEIYKNATPEVKISIDNDAANYGADYVTKNFKSISDGNASSYNEAVEYNKAIDDKQLGIDQFADKTRMALQAGNLVGKAARINKIDREASEDVDKNTQAILNNVMPQIKKSQALQQALGSAQYGAQAGLPPEVMGALNSANQVATANAMNAASGTGAIGLIHNNALANARRLAVDGLQYKNQQQQLLGNLAGQDQAINTRQGGIDAQGELMKMQLRNQIAREGREVGRSMDVERDALGDTLSYMIPNGTRKAMEIAALNKIRNREIFNSPDTSAIGREVGASFGNLNNMGTGGLRAGTSLIDFTDFNR